MAYEWTAFTDYLDGSRPILKAERDELWDALAALLERCGGRWRLKTADMDAIKASLAITDLTSLEASGDTETTELGDLAAVLIAIEDTFTGATGYDAFKAVRAAEGLDSDDKLAEFVDAGGRVTQADTFHLWNLYKRILTYLDCCPAGAPTFQWDSVSASKTKCGFVENSGFESTPPKIYLKKRIGNDVTYSSVNAYFVITGGGITEYTYTAATRLKSYRSDQTTDAAVCSIASVYTGDTDDLMVIGAARAATSSCPAPSLGSATDVTYPATVFFSLTEPSMSATSSTRKEGTLPDSLWKDVNVKSATIADACSGIPMTEPSGGTLLVTESYFGFCQLSDEYTTAALITAAVAALTAFDDDWDDTAGSYRNLASDELSLSLRQSKARIPLAGLTLTVGRTYRGSYIPRFTPLVGDVVDGAEAYIEFTFEEGMEFTDEIAVDVPAENGTNILVGVRWECGPFAP